MKYYALPEDFFPLVRHMLRIPDAEVNMLDIASRSFRNGAGEPLFRLTSSDEKAQRYLVGSPVLSRSHYKRVVESQTIISTQAKITLATFPLIFAAPPVNDYVADEYRLSDTHIRLPDFESRAKRNMVLKRQQKKVTDDTLGIEVEVEEKPEESEARLEKEREDLEKEILALKKAEQKRINEHDFETSSQRNELVYLQHSYKLLAPEGVLLFMTHRQLMDKPFLQYLHTSFDHVELMNIPEDTHNRILIMAKRRPKKVSLETDQVNEWLRHRYGNELEPLPDIGLVERVYHVPAVPPEQLLQFRIGRITEDEVDSLSQRSSLIERTTMNEMRLATYEPVAPAPLHKGHLVQLLTSGMMDSYIGQGQEQHLVKGSSVRLINETIEQNGEEEITTKRDYYTVNLKLLLPDGTFRRVR